MKWCRKTETCRWRKGEGVGLRYLLLLLHYNKPVHTCYICSAGIRNATVMMITQTVTLTVKNNDLTLRLWVRVTCVKLLIYHSLYCENVRIAVWLVRLLSFWCWQKQIFAVYKMTMVVKMSLTANLVTNIMLAERKEFLRVYFWSLDRTYLR